ncbi:hypothetical protein K432DRAFT_466952, partial [Lepidopterella palustris CBS 459.81]
ELEEEELEEEELEEEELEEEELEEEELEEEELEKEDQPVDGPSVGSSHDSSKTANGEAPPLNHLPILSWGPEPMASEANDTLLQYCLDIIDQALEELARPTRTSQSICEIKRIAHQTDLNNPFKAVSSEIEASFSEKAQNTWQNSILRTSPLTKVEHELFQESESHAKECRPCSNPLQTQYNGGQLCVEGRISAHLIHEMFFERHDAFYRRPQQYSPGIEITFPATREHRFEDLLQAIELECAQGGGDFGPFRPDDGDKVLCGACC